jgi:hypothetical protein
VALLAAVPIGLIALLVAGALWFRRSMSLPTADGRAPLVGLDRELSREALLRYQALKGPGSVYEALPLGHDITERSRRLGEPPNVQVIEAESGGSGCEQ